MPNATIAALRRALSNRQKQTVDAPSLKPASVLGLLYSKNGEYCMLLNKRTEAVEHHKGEIAFPGGSKDSGDKDFLDTALRETYEEMGIKPEDVTILGELDDVVTASHFAVRPFVGTIPYPYPFKTSPIEIAEVLEVPVRELLDQANLREEVRWVDGRVVKSHCYAYGDHLVFGATAKIVKQLLQSLSGTDYSSNDGSKVS